MDSLCCVVYISPEVIPAEQTVVCAAAEEESVSAEETDSSMVRSKCLKSSSNIKLYSC